jgi:hypothetical protein
MTETKAEKEPSPEAASKEALDIAETLVNHQWGVSVYRLARALDAFRREGVEKERERVTKMLRKPSTEFRRDLYSRWKTLKRYITDSNIPKNEAEWWAHHAIARLEQERDTALHEAEGRMSAYLVASKQLAESQREAEALRAEVGRLTRDEAVVEAARKLGDAMNNCQSCDAEFQELWDALATRDAAL